MGDIDPAKKQYIIFSAIISFILAVIWNFFLVEIMKGSDFGGYGFPVGFGDSSGLGLFLLRIVNSLILTFFLIVPVYAGLQWLQRKTGAS